MPRAALFFPPYNAIIEGNKELIRLHLTLQNLMIRAFVLFTAMPIHECAHALVASWLGDDTAEFQGRLTLNPLSHLDLVGSLMILVAGFGWAKPVPVNPLNFRRNGVSMRGGMALTAAAGPLSNLLLGFIFFLLSKIIWAETPLPIELAILFLMVSQINIILAVFNLLPVYPLDGGRIAGFFLPDKALDWMEQHGRMIQMGFMILVLFTDVLDAPLGFLQQKVLQGFDALTSLGGILPQLL